MWFHQVVLHVSGREGVVCDTKNNKEIRVSWSDGRDISSWLSTEQFTLVERKETHK